ncbi:MAG: hypothetical protein C4316_00240 [Chloroflexota bacterium]
MPAVIPTPAARLKTEPIKSPRRPGYAPLDLEALYHAHQLAAARWSADGRFIYLETNITGRFNIWRMPAGGGWPEQLTVSDERTRLEGPSPDSRWLIYTQDRAGNEKPNIFLLPAAGGRPRNLTRTEGVGYRSIRWSPDGRFVAFAAERDGPGQYAVYLADVVTAEITRVAGTEHGQCASLRWSPDGRRLALTRTHDFLHSGITLLDLDTRQEKVLIPLDGEHITTVVDWLPDGRHLVINSNANGADVEAVGLLDTTTGWVDWLTLGEWESYALAVSRTRPEFVYVRNVAGSHQAFIRHPDGPETPIPLPEGVCLSAEFHPSGRRLLLLYASADSPPEAWRLDRPTGRIYRLTRSLVGGLSRRSFVRPQLAVYRSFDGTPIAAFVYVPPNIRPDGSHPAVVYAHGGPTWQHQNGWFPDIQFLVSHGFIVIAPNFRGSTGFGRPFQEANRRDLGGGDLRDVVAALDFLRASGYVNPKAVAVMGASYGGYLTLMALAKYPDLWAAGVAIVPFANWFTEFENEDPTLQAYDRVMMGDPVIDAELWRDRSPIFFADRIKAPLLLLAGANDIRCPVEETRQIAEAVRSAGGVVEVKIYANEGHGFSRRENRIDAFRRVVDFLRRHVPGVRP